MTYARHKARGRFSRLDPRRVDAAVVVTGVAMLAVSALGAGLSSATAPSTAAAAAPTEQRLAAPTSAELAVQLQERQVALERSSRNADRVAAAVAPKVAPPPTQPVAPVTTPAFTTIALNVRAAASQDAPVITVLDAGAEVALTGNASGDYLEILLDGALAWVYASYVADTPPAEDAGSAGGPVSGEPCSTGSGVESGLASNAISVHRAVCALYPGLTYGGVRPGDGGEHGSGHALDIMCSTDVGNAISAYLQAHAGELGISELIWRQRIWSVERAGDGWRWMEDRGSATANHYDHVHVTVY